MLEWHTINTKLAALLLLQEGEITLDDIEALPFVETPEEAAVIAFTLVRSLDAERYQRKRLEAGLSFWEDVVRLKEPAARADDPRGPCQEPQLV